jgi:KDO2-lipid IV(A) lauroyltransferase
MMVPFLGCPARTPSGAALLALDTGAPVITGFIRREGVGTHVLYISPPLVVPSEGPVDARVHAILAQANARIEAAVRAAPADWPWFHARWRSAGRVTSPD